MGRASVARLGARQPGKGEGFDPDVPAPGFYAVRLRRGAPQCALEIFCGPPRDPESGEEMLERPFARQARLNGAEEVDPMRFWPACASSPISAAEHARLCARNATDDEDSPFYDPLRPINKLAAPPPF